MKVVFTVHRSGWTQYEAEVPEGFDTSDFVAMLKLADTKGTQWIGGDTTHLSIFVGDKQI